MTGRPYSIVYGRDLPRKVLFALAGIALAFCIKSAWWAGTYAACQLAALSQQRAVDVELAAWRAAAESDQSALGSLRAAGKRAVDRAAAGLGALQAEIIRLNALVEQIYGQAGANEKPFEARSRFEPSPPLGGPEVALGPYHDSATELRALIGVASGLSARLQDRARQFTLFQELVKVQRLSERTRPLGWPVRSGYISSPFGARIDPFTGRQSAHRGMDFAARPGTDVTAVASGIVIWSAYRPGYGKTVDIDHGNEYVTRYAHNSENLVAVGDVVGRGDVVSRVGATGRATGPHLHFEVLRGGEAVSPLTYIREQAVDKSVSNGRSGR